MSPKMQRPKAVRSWTIERKTHCGEIYVTVTYVDDKPFEVFVRFGKAGGCGSAIADGLAKILSVGFRSGMEPKDAVKNLSGIICHKGKETCMHVIATCIAFVDEHLRTGEDIDDIMDRYAYANDADHRQGVAR